MNFEAAFEKLIDPQHEGGYVNDPRDPGGETMLGITVAVARANGYAGAMKDMPRATAAAIYQVKYWTPAGCDVVPDVLKFDLFDMAVNQGVPSAVKALQHAVGVLEDGALGPMTVQAAQAALPVRLLFRFDAARLVHYAENSDTALLTYGRGWLRRVATNMNGY